MCGKVYVKSGFVFYVGGGVSENRGGFCILGGGWWGGGGGGGNFSYLASKGGKGRCDLTFAVTNFFLGGEVKRIADLFGVSKNECMGNWECTRCRCM